MKVDKVRGARNLGVAKEGRGDAENYRPRNHARVVGKPEIAKIAIISTGWAKKDVLREIRGYQL